MNQFIQVFLILTTISLSGCQTTASYDYTNFERSKPKSILVLPPLNHTTAPEASDAVLSQVTVPLAEAGYYVLPVALTRETFFHNGMVTNEDIHSLPTSKLYEVFGADSALYIDITRYGTKYYIIDSLTEYSANATLIDLKTSAILWEGRVDLAVGSNSDSLLGVMISQMVKTTLNHQYVVSQHGTYQLLDGQQLRSPIPFGPYHEKSKH